MEVYVIATLTAEKEFSPNFLELVKEVVALTQKQKGCIMYQPTEDMKGERPNEIVIMQKWATFEDLQAHLKAEHLVKLGGALKEHSVKADIKVQKAKM